MAKGVRGDMLGNTSELSVLLDDSLDRTGSEAAVITASVGFLKIAAVVEEKGG